MQHIGTNVRVLILALIALSFGAAVVGCESIEKLKAERGVLDNAIAHLDGEIAKYPADSDEAKQLAKQRDALVKGRDIADKLIASAEGGDFSFLGSLGPWGATLGAGLGFLWKWKREHEQRSVLKTVVASVEAAKPTEEQKDTMAAVQGPATTAVVKQIKSATK